MKKILNKKVAAAVAAVALALGICDLTLMEESRLKPVLQDAKKAATSLFEEEQQQDESLIVAPKEEAPASQPADSQ